MGSSLKICLVADGQAGLYPRLGPTSEWDTAAIHAVLTGAHGQITIAGTDPPLTYNQKRISPKAKFHLRRVPNLIAARNLEFALVFRSF